MNQIPTNWQLVKFNDFATLQRGKDLTKDSFKSGNVPVAGSNGIIGYHNEFFVKAPGVTVGRSGSCGKVNFYNVDFWAHNTSLYVRDFHGNDEKFAAFFLEFLDLGRFHTGASVPTLDRNSFKQLPIAIPNVPEQRRIAHVLSTVQTAIEQQARLIALTRELKAALMRQLFTAGLRGEKQKETEIGPVPESWEIKPFEEFTTLQRGKDLTKNEFKNGNVPVAGSNGIIGYHDTAFVKAPGITVGRSGSAGKVTFYDQDFWAHNTSLYVKDFHGNDPRFAAYYLDLMDLAKFKTGASVPTLDRNSFKQMPVAVPSKDEQMEIGRILATTDKKIEITNLHKEKLEELFRALLHQLMTGQVRVNTIDLTGSGKPVRS